MIWKDQGYTSALSTLTQKQRIAYLAFAVGAIFPLFFLGVVRPVFWLAAFQLACAAGLAYIRWRSPAFQGSVVVVVAAAVASIVSLLAAAVA